MIGLITPDVGHLDQTGMPERVADAMRRGALCHGSIDFLGLDWFDLASLQMDDVRSRFDVVPKRSGLRSPGPFEPGGMSPSQSESGHAAAASRGVEYLSYGATPS